MQSLIYSSSQSLPLLKPRRASSSNSRFVQIRLSSFPSSPKPHFLNHVAVSASLPRRTYSLSSSSSSPFKLRPWTSLSSLRSGGEANRFDFREAPVRGSAGGCKAGFNSLMKTCLAFGVDYLFDIFFNKYQQQILKFHRVPVTHTTVQFAIGAVIGLFIVGFNIYIILKISGLQELLQNQMASLLKVNKEEIAKQEINRLIMEVQTCQNKAKYDKYVLPLLKCRACKVCEVHLCLHKDCEGDCCYTS